MRPQRVHLIPHDWQHLEVELNHLTRWISSQATTPLSSPTFIGLTLTGLTATRLIATGAGGVLASVDNLASWVAGTTNQVSVTNDGDGTITLALPQSIHTAATPTFGGLTLGTLAGVIKGTAGVLSGSATMDDVANGSSTTMRTNLNADLLDGQHGAYYASASGYVPYTGATTTLNLGAQNLTTTGTLGAGAITGTSDITVNGNFGFKLASGATRRAYQHSDGTNVIQYVDVAGFYEINMTADAGSALRVSADGTIKLGAYTAGIVTSDAAGILGLDTNTYYKSGDSPSFVTASLSSQLKILEGGATPTKYTIFQGGDQTVDLTYTLPTALGAAGTVLTDAAGNGVLSWVAGGGGTSDHAALSHLAYADSGHTGFQATHASLTDIVGLAVTDGNIIIGNGTNWIAESGATARTSLGLGSGDDVTFSKVSIYFNDATSGFDIVGDSQSVGCNMTGYADATTGPSLSFLHARGSLASPAVVQSGDRLCALYGFGYSAAAAAFRQAGSVAIYIDGTPDSAGDTTDMPGRIQFNTTPEGASTPVERLRVNNAGGVFMYALKTGTTQAGAGAAANELWEHSTTHVIYKGI